MDKRIKRVAEFFGKPIRLPGWAVMLLGAYSFIPDQASRLEFWRGVPIPAQVQSTLASPFFGIGLIFLAVMYLWFFPRVVHVHHGNLTAQTAPQASLSMQVLRAADRVPVQDAMMYAINRVWPGPDDKLKDGQENLPWTILARMRGLAGEGRLTIWGKLSQGHLHTAIPPEFWVTQQIEYMTVVFEDHERSKTEPAALQSHREIYYDLQVDRHQIETLWPKW